MTSREALQDAGRRLEAAGCESPHVDAELLLAARARSLANRSPRQPDRTLDRRRGAPLRVVVERRGRREPTAYILGEWGFRGLTLCVDPRVLVPRPDTETVVERASTLRRLDQPLVLDVGTGSGAIALAIAYEHPGARVVATDISADALALAAENRRRTALDDRVELVLGHLVAGQRGPFDLVVSNPPYVPTEEYDGLEPEIRTLRAVRGRRRHRPDGRDRAACLRDPATWRLARARVVRHPRRRRRSRAAGARLRGRHGDRDLAGRERVVEGRRSR